MNVAGALACVAELAAARLGAHLLADRALSCEDAGAEQAGVNQRALARPLAAEKRRGDAHDEVAAGSCRQQRVNGRGSAWVGGGERRRCAL